MQATLPGKPRILIVEDDERIVRLLDRFLGQRGYELHFERECLRIPCQLRELAPDLILLDWVLPTRPGIDILRALRNEPRYSSLPVIMLTGKNDELHRVEGLLTGADDYICKPFSLAELEARMISVLRRSQGKKMPYVDGHLEIDPEEKILVVGGEPRLLTIQEWALLGALMGTSKALSRKALVEAVWGRGHEVSDRTIDVMVLKLRRTLEPDPRDPCYILTERGAGYRFVSRRNGAG